MSRRGKAMNRKKLNSKSARPVQGKVDRRFPSYSRHLQRRNLSPRTVETYGECLRTFWRWLEEQGIRDPRHVVETDLAIWPVWLARQCRRDGRRFSAAHRAKHIAVIRSFYRFLDTERKVISNPAIGLKYPKVLRRINREVLDGPGLARLLSLGGEGRAGLRDSAAVRLLAVTGLRSSELVGLSTSDVNVQARELVVRKGKGGKDRLAFFDRATRRVLEDYVENARPGMVATDEEAFIVNDHGRRMQPFQLRLIVRRRGKRAGLVITPHCLRHTFCTLMLKAGANLKAIAELAGHVRLSTTARYTRVDIHELSAVYSRSHPRCTQ